MAARIVLSACFVLAMSTGIGSSMPAVRAAGETCVDYRESNPVAGWIQLGGHYEDIAVRGDFLYAVGHSKLAVFDIADPASITRVGDHELDGYYYQIEIVGDRAFLGGSSTPITVLDLSIPGHPVVLSQVPAGTSSYTIHVDEHGLYVWPSAGRTLELFDTNSSDCIRPVGTVAFAGVVTRIVSKGSHLIVQCRNPGGGLGLGLQVVDVADLASPRSVAAFPFDPACAFLQVIDEYLLFGGYGANGIHVFDISSLPDLVHLGRKSEFQGSWPQVTAGLLSVFDGERMNVLDTGRLPELDFLYAVPEGIGSYRGCAGGGLVFAGIDGSAFRSVRVIDPRVDPRQQGPDWTSSQYYLPGRMRERGDLLYSGHAHGLDIFGRATDGSLQLLSTIWDSGGGGIVDFQFVGDKLVFLNAHGRLGAFDVSDPSRFRRLGYLDIGQQIPFYRASALAVDGDYAYVGTRGNTSHVGFIITVKMEDPEPYSIVGSEYFQDNINHLTVVDGCLVAAIGRSTLATFGVPGHRHGGEGELEKGCAPRRLGSVESNFGLNGVSDMIQVGRHVFTLGYGMLNAVDCGDPRRPCVVSSYPMPILDTGYRLSYAAGVLYAAVRDMGVVVVDARDPSRLDVMGYVNTAGDNRSVAAAFDGLYVGFYPDELRRYPLQCAERPLAFAVDIRPGQDDNFVACKAGAGILPVAVLSSPGLDATAIDHTTVCLGPGAAKEAKRIHGMPVRRERDVDRDGDVDLVFHFRVDEIGVRCGDEDLSLSGETFDGLAVAGTGSIRTAPWGTGKPAGADDVVLAPNPFNPMTNITFSVGAAGRVRVSVHDVRGREVCCIADDKFSSGTHVVKWLGRDGQGRAVATGTYFVRIETGHWTRTQKAILLR